MCSKSRLPNRNKPDRSKPYALSEESKKSAHEFACAIKTASKLLQLLKPFVPSGQGRTVFNKLSAQLLRIIRSGPEEHKGKRQISDGDIRLLHGFQLNPYKALDSFMYFSPLIDLFPLERHLTISLPELHADLFKTPEKACGIALNFLVSILPSEGDSPLPLVSEDLEFAYSSGRLSAKTIRFPLPYFPAYTLLVSMKAHFRIGNRNDSFLSGNRLHYAASILRAVYIKDGLIQEVPQVSSTPKKKSQALFQDTQTVRIKWNE